MLGASAPGIVGLLSKEYALLVLPANGLAWPVTLLVMQRWLETFAYPIDPGFFTLLLAGVAALLAYRWVDGELPRPPRRSHQSYRRAAV